MTEPRNIEDANAEGKERETAISKSPRRSARRAKVIVTLVLLWMILLLISGFRSKTSVQLTEEHARAYAGILASVIPIFVVALYVDGSRSWGRLVANQKDSRGKEESIPTVLIEGTKPKRKLFQRRSKWSGVSVTPLQLLSPLLGEVFALGCFLVPTNIQIRFATFWMTSLLGLFAFRLVEWAAIPEDESIDRWSASFSAILLLSVFAGYIPYILKISIIR